MTGCVVCNGEIRDHVWAKARIATCDLVIAADGGADHLRAMEIVPNLIVGDMDSLREEFWISEVTIEKAIFPKDKDKTDAELAVELAFERGCNFVFLIGASGGRLDHCMGNISLLSKFPGRLAMVTSDATLVAVDRSEKCRLHGEPGARVSLIPFPLAEQVTTTGLQYALAKQDLLPGTMGISNTLVLSEGCVRVGEGILLVYMESKKGAAND